MSEENDYATTGDLLQVYRTVGVEPLIEVFRKTAEQYYHHKIDLCKVIASVLGVPMAFVLNETFEKTMKFKLYMPGSIRYLCQDKLEKLMNCSCNGPLKFGGYCE